MDKVKRYATYLLVIAGCGGLLFDFGAEYEMPVPAGVGVPLYKYPQPNAYYKIADDNPLKRTMVTPETRQMRAYMANPETPNEGVSWVDRNQAVEKAIKGDPLLSRKYAGGINSPGAEIARDFAGSVASNTAAREGVTRNVVGYADPSKMSMEDKRTAALWNRQMNRLRSGIVDKAKTPEQRREYADGVMNALTYGLDNLPEDTFRRNPGLYRAIAAEHGQDGWKHWSEQPTTASTQRILED